jgi:hypothetical protein
MFFADGKQFKAAIYYLRNYNDPVMLSGSEGFLKRQVFPPGRQVF